jgi:hypothetical protein
VISESQVSSQILIRSNLEALKIMAFLEGDQIKKKTIIDQMATLGTISIPYISQLMSCSNQLADPVPSDVMEYCRSKIDELKKESNEYGE